MEGAIVESRSGRELFKTKSFIDCTGYADLAAYAGADFTEPNDYPVVNSIGLGNVDIELYYEFLKSQDALGQLAYGKRSGRDNQIIRLNGRLVNFSREFVEKTRGLNVATTTTTVHDNYFMFIKCGLKLPKSPTDRDIVTDVEIRMRENQFKYVQAIRKYIPGLENAFIARTAPSLVIRRERLIKCDYDITHEDVIEARHFDDEVFNYGFHDCPPATRLVKAKPMEFHTGLCVLPGLITFLLQE